MTTKKSTGERRREIVDAAIKIIGERGLREFTAAHLAHEVGIKDGTIFRHFKGMNEILLAVLDKMHELLGTAPQPTEDPLERLRKFVMNRLHAAATQTGIQSLLFSDQISHALGSEGPKSVATLRNRGRNFIRSCLREAVEKRLIREDIDIECAVLLITGMVMSFLFAVKDGALPATIDEMGERFWQTLLPMLERKEPTP